MRGVTPRIQERLSFCNKIKSSWFSSVQRGCGRCDCPGIQPEGASNDPVLKSKKVVINFGRGIEEKVFGKNCEMMVND